MRELTNVFATHQFRRLWLLLVPLLLISKSCNLLICIQLNQKKVALVIGRLSIICSNDQLPKQMIYLSDHQTIASQCAIPNAQCYLYWISCIRLLWDDPYAHEQTCEQWRQQGFASGLSPCPHVSGYLFLKEGTCLGSSWGCGRSSPVLRKETFIFMSFILLIFAAGFGNISLLADKPARYPITETQQREENCSRTENWEK